MTQTEAVDIALNQEAAQDGTTEATRKTGRPPGSRTRPKPGALGMMKADSLIELHRIATDRELAASDRIEACRLLLFVSLGSEL